MIDLLLGIFCSQGNKVSLQNELAYNSRLAGPKAQFKNARLSTCVVYNTDTLRNETRHPKISTFCLVQKGAMLKYTTVGYSYKPGCPQKHPGASLGTFLYGLFIRPISPFPPSLK